MTVQELARRAATNFHAEDAGDYSYGTLVYVDRSTPRWVFDLVTVAHYGGRYKASATLLDSYALALVASALVRIADGRDPDVRRTVDAGDLPALCDWAASDEQRSALVDAELDICVDGGVNATFAELLAGAQAREVRAVYAAVLNALEARASA